MYRLTPTIQFRTLKYALFIILMNTHQTGSPTFRAKCVRLNPRMRCHVGTFKGIVLSDVAIFKSFSEITMLQLCGPETLPIQNCVFFEKRTYSLLIMHM